MPPLSLMIKPASSRCNLACVYCFYRDVAAQREQSDFSVMTRQTAKTLIDRALQYADGAPCCFTFQGGEPMLAGLDYYRFFTEYAARCNEKNSPILYALQTNGTRMDDEWASFFAREHFLIGLSLDGSRKHNKFRLQPNGENSFDSAVAAAETLKRNRVDFNILTVLTGHCAEHGEEIYRYFRAKGFRHLQFIPCLRPFGSAQEGELYMTAEQYGNFLIDVFRLYARDYAEGNYISVRQFDNWVRLFRRQMPEQCGMSGRCARQFVAESNGNIYPCDFYCTDAYLLGNIMTANFTEMTQSERARKFLHESNAVPEKCKKCGFYPLCRAGGCKRTVQSADYCAAYRRFFQTCLPLFRVFAEPQSPAGGHFKATPHNSRLKP